MPGISPNMPPHLKLVSYNLEALGRDLGKSPEAEKAREEKLQNLGKTIGDLNGDIVMLQEISSQEDLNSFTQNNLPKGLYQYQQFFQTNDSQNRQLGILSKYPITDAKSHTDAQFPVEGRPEPGKFLRDAPMAEINVGGYPIAFYDVHLKADPYFRREDAKSADKLAKADNMRTAEAQEIRKIIQEETKSMPSKLYVLAGDCNTTPDTRAISTFRQEGPGQLVDPMAGTKEISHEGAGKKFDYIFVSPEMSKAVVPDSAKIVHSPGSDHFPITLTIDMDKI
ncbi:MAG: endonuclease/exonuclease/phosphatase family protein [Candidatus Xenobiia bacterium LiM19]